MKADKWKSLRDEYMAGDTTYSELSRKYGVSISAVSQRAKSEHWRKKDMRSGACDKPAEDASASDTARRIEELANLILDKLEQAIGELCTYTSTATVKTKEVEYGNAERPDKVTRETVREEELVTAYEGAVDRNGLKQVTGVLKELRDIYSEADGDGEGSAAAAIQVVLGKAEEYAE